MKSFWSGFANAFLNTALQGAAGASSQKADLKTVGITALLGGLVGILQYTIQHPATSSPVTNAVIGVPQPVQPTPQTVATDAPQT